MAGSIQPLRPSATFALRRCGCFAAVLCAAWFVAGARPAPAGPDSQARVTPAPAAACNRLARDAPIPQTLRLSVSVARHSSPDYAFVTRHRRLRIKRFGRSSGGLPSGTALRNAPRVAGIAGAIEIASLHLPAPSRDHARAPPLLHHPV